MEGNPVGWFEIYVEDMGRAKQFYETVFQVSLRKLNSVTPELWAFPQSLANYGAGGSLAKMEGFAAGRNSTLVYFSCQDCLVEQERIFAAGGSLLREKFSIGEFGFIALALDTEKNMFGLHSMK